MDSATAYRLQLALGSTYTVEREFSGGGMARVFVAYDSALQRRVVVKQLPDHFAAGVSLERFRREVQVLARLQHPNIVPVLLAGEVDGLPFFTMPFIEGESLRAAIGRERPLDVDTVIAVLRDVATALNYAHEQGVMHRDIKPDNVLLSGSIAMVTDFGVAKAIAASGGQSTSSILTSIGVIVGTPAYMAPEQAAADPMTDHRADIYAFGAMGYELLTGLTPFGERTPQSLMAAHISEVPVDLIRRRPDLPPALAALIMQCLAKKSEDRPQSARELVLRLSASSLKARQPSMTKHRAKLAGLTGGVVLAVVAIQMFQTEASRNARLAMMTSTAARIQYADELFDASRYEEAAQVLAPILSPSYLYPVTADQRVTTLKYMGVVHAAFDRPDSAIVYFTAALNFDPFADLDPGRFQGKELAAFFSATQRLLRVGIAPLTEARSPAGEPLDYQFRVVSAQRVRLTVAILSRADTAVRATLYDGESQGLRLINWNGGIAGRRAEAGSYEVLAVARYSANAGVDSARRVFTLRYEASGEAHVAPGAPRQP